MLKRTLRNKVITQLLQHFHVKLIPTPHTNDVHKYILLAVLIVIGTLGIRAYQNRTKAGDQKTVNTQNLLLPDLVILPPEKLLIQQTNGQKELRFSTSFANLGKGPLELTSKDNPEADTTQVLQTIYTENGGTQQRVVGKFIYHPEHSHWHLENITNFELWTIGDDRMPEEKLAATEKMSFCIQDWEQYKEAPQDNAASQTYVGCNKKTQGLSVGWIDKYGAGVEGQMIDITGIANGNYIIRSVIDPANSISEINEDNNAVLSYVTLENNTVTKIDKP